MKPNKQNLRAVITEVLHDLGRESEPDPIDAYVGFNSSRSRHRLGVAHRRKIVVDAGWTPEELLGEARRLTGGAWPNGILLLEHALDEQLN